MTWHQVTHARPITLLVSPRGGEDSFILMVKKATFVTSVMHGITLIVDGEQGMMSRVKCKDRKPDGPKRDKGSFSLLDESIWNMMSHLQGENDAVVDGDERKARNQCFPSYYMRKT